MVEMARRENKAETSAGQVGAPQPVVGLTRREREGLQRAIEPTYQSLGRED